MLAESAGGVSGCSSLSESADGGGGADCCQRQQVEVQVEIVCKNQQVKAVVQIAGRGSRWSFGFQLSPRIFRWRRQCRFLLEAAGGVSGFSSLAESSGGGVSADGW